MKVVLLVFSLLLCTFCEAQNVLIPFRIGSAFGLSDQAGKMKVAASYDKIHWLEGNWFSSSKNIVLNDTLDLTNARSIRRNSTISTTGLLNGTREILKDEPFDAYEIVARKCIVAKCSRRVEELTKEQFAKYGNHRIFYSLFSLEGENLHPENFSSIRKIDSAGLSLKYKGEGRYILFMTYNFQNKSSLFVFDGDKGKIVDWLIRDADKIQVNANRSVREDKQLNLLVDTQNERRRVKVIDYSQGVFVIKDGAVSLPTEKLLEPRNDIGAEMVVELPRSEGYYSDVAVPFSSKENIARAAPKFRTFHLLKKDSLFFITGESSKVFIPLPNDSRVIFRSQESTIEYGSVFIKKGEQFFILNEDKPGELAYDSLIYYGGNFIAWKPLAGKSKAGIITMDETEIVPFIYDSIYADIPFLEFVDTNPARTPTIVMRKKEADSRYNYDKPYPYARQISTKISVFKNGKCGVVELDGTVLIPIEYELIAQNSDKYSGMRDDNYLILKREGLYGITKLMYDREKKATTMEATIAPVFADYPAFIYHNYYGKKGLTLIGLIDKNERFKGYANDKGQLYFKD